MVTLPNILRLSSEKNRYIHLLNCFLIIDLETSALEEKNKRDHYAQLVGACLVRIVLAL